MFIDNKIMWFGAVNCVGGEILARFLLKNNLALKTNPDSHLFVARSNIEAVRGG